LAWETRAKTGEQFVLSPWEISLFLTHWSAAKVENIDYETVALSTDPGFIEILEKSRAQLKKEGGISHEEMRREFEEQ